MAENQYTIPNFMSALIAALVLRGIREIAIPVGSGKDKLRIRAVSALASDICSYHVGHPNKPPYDDWTKFLVRARNMLSPDSVGTFSGLSAQLVDKSLGLVNVGPEYFELEVSPPHARSILAEADELLREFVGALVDTFEESSKKKASFDN